MDRFIITRMSELDSDRIREKQYLLFPSKKSISNVPAAFQPKWNGRLELKMIFLVSSIHSGTGELEAFVFTRFDVVNSFY